MRGLHVSVIALAWAAAPPLQLPIPTPDKSPWEVTFVEVEELAGLPPLASAPRDTQELRVMHRPWSAMSPAPFLRVFRDDSALRAEFFVFGGGPSYSPDQLSIDRPNTRCSPSGPRKMCVTRVDLREERHWDVYFTAEWSFCTPGEQRLFVADAPAIWLRMWSDRRYREDYCSNLTPGTPAGDLYEWMAREAAAAVARW
jgi:hypothetical protein